MTHWPLPGAKITRIAESCVVQTTVTEDKPQHDAFFFSHILGEDEPTGEHIDDEGITWIRGWYSADSKEVAAVRVARALGASRL